MESNKPLSVHMTHHEYEQYKKFNKLVKSEGKRVFWGSKTTRYYGSDFIEYEIYSEAEVKIIADEFLKDHIERLEKEKKELEEKVADYRTKVVDLSDTINVQKQTITLFNSYDYSMFKKSWWRSLWN